MSPERSGPGAVARAEAGTHAAWQQRDLDSMGPRGRASGGRWRGWAVTPLDAALAYARQAWPVFPCHWAGDRDLSDHFSQAVIEALHHEHPDAFGGGQR
jgi:hypothetical protein